MLLILTVLELNIFQKKFKNLLKIKTKKTNIFRIQAHNSIMCKYFCIGFIDFMLKGKSSTDFTKALTLLIFFHQVILKRMMI